MEETISKKDLLALKNITYGQLYRWKREGLIPEEWFVKKAVKTGQETFLPKEKACERIDFILANKDRIPLGQMAKMLSPGAGGRTYNLQQLRNMSEIDRGILGMIAGDTWSGTDVAFLAIISEAYRKYHLTYADAGDLIRYCGEKFSELSPGEHVFYLVRIRKVYYGMLLEQENPVMDSRIEVIQSWPVEELAGRISLKYQPEPETP
ncbi:MAG: DUF4004 family protein [Lachnospiraceae bacterium]